MGNQRAADIIKEIAVDYSYRVLLGWGTSSAVKMQEIVCQKVTLPQLDGVTFGVGRGDLEASQHIFRGQVKYTDARLELEIAQGINVLNDIVSQAKATWGNVADRSGQTGSWFAEITVYADDRKTPVVIVTSEHGTLVGPIVQGLALDVESDGKSIPTKITLQFEHFFETQSTAIQA